MVHYKNFLPRKKMLKVLHFALYPCRFSSQYFVSTPIFYVNGLPHIGHVQTCMYADAFARTNRLLGKDVIFSTGTDEHGLKVQQAAEAAKKNPQEFCSVMSKNFQEIFHKSSISSTHFIRTTDEKHKQIVQEFWTKLRSNGYIRKGTYEGWYSVIDEAFVPSSQVKEIKEGSNTKMISVETGSSVERMSEENYVFPLPEFKDQLLHWLSKDVIKPSHFADDVRRWIHEGLYDLSVSRPISRLSWGIPVPEDNTQVIYVWLDALVNYLTVGMQEGKHIWPVSCHVIGKDILKFHAIYWPAFLIAAGYEPPQQIFCHSHWIVNHEKMSKSKGNVIDPMDLINKYDCDGFRYLLLKASVPQSDTNYCEEKVHDLINSGLADTLGNLLNRCCAKSLNPEQMFPQFSHRAFESICDIDTKKLIERTADLPGVVKQLFMEGNFYKGLDSIMECLRFANTFMQHQEPWKKIKESDALSKEKVHTVIHIVMEVLRISGILLQPVVPTLSSRLLSKLNVPDKQRQWINLQCFPSYYDKPNPCEGNLLGTEKKPLYERRILTKNS